MEEYFQKLRNLKSGKVRFEDELFPPNPWDSFGEARELVESDFKSYEKTEKKVVLDSLKEFVQSQPNESVHFNGGAVFKVIPKSADDPIVLNCEMPHDNEIKYDAVALGELAGCGEAIEKANYMFHRMVIAMQLGDRIIQKTSLRYFIQDHKLPDEYDDLERMAFMNFINFIVASHVKILVVFGNTDLQHILGVRTTLGKYHGKFIEKTVKYLNGEYKFTIMATFHPEYLGVKTDMKRTAWEELQKVMAFLK